MDVDRRWPLFDDFILELGHGRSASLRSALERIHRHVMSHVGDEPSVDRLGQVWVELLDPDALPGSHALATRYVSTLRRFRQHLDGDVWDQALAAAQRVVDERHRDPEPDDWANRVHPRFGWHQVEPSTTLDG